MYRQKREQKGTATNVISDTPKNLICEERHTVMRQLSYATNVIRRQTSYATNIIRRQKSCAIKTSYATKVICDKHHMRRTSYATNIICNKHKQYQEIQDMFYEETFITAQRINPWNLEYILYYNKLHTVKIYLVTMAM